MRDEAVDLSAPVAELARVALERTEGNLDEAARMLERWAGDCAPLRDAITQPFLAQACYQAAVAASWYERRIRWKPAGADRHHGVASTLAYGSALADDGARADAPPTPP